MEQRAGNAAGDGDHFFLTEKDLHLWCGGEIGQVDGASAANHGGGFVGDCNAGNCGQQLAGVDEQIGSTSLLSADGQFFQGVGIFKDKFGGGCSAQRFEVRAATEFVPHVVS